WSAGEGGCSERDKEEAQQTDYKSQLSLWLPLDSIEVMGERRALAKTVHHHGQHLPPSASDCGGLKQLLQQQTQTSKASLSLCLLTLALKAFGLTTAFL
ncbi:hypothetical protein L3Q82_023648, partial [Scortum barcoo]